MMSTFAFAKDVDSGKGGRASITIENASKGETYTVYKILNAKVSSKNDTNGKSESVTYQLLDGHTNIPSIFKKDANNLVWNGTTAPNVLSEIDVAVLEKYVDDEKLDAEAIAESDGSTLIFKNLTYGYYLIKSSQGSAVTVTSTTPNATIHDKNGNTPGGDKYKKIVDDTDVYIGQTVNYTLTYPTSNYIGSGANAKQVVKYTVSDTLPDYLDSVTLTSVKIYNKDYGVEGATPVEEADLTSSVTFNTTSKSFDIVWAENGTSKYTNGAVIEVKCCYK